MEAFRGRRDYHGKRILLVALFLLPAAGEKPAPAPGKGAPAPPEKPRTLPPPRSAAVAAETEGTPQTGAGQLQLRAPREMAGAKPEENAAARLQPLEQDEDAGQGDIGLARALHGERVEVTDEDGVDVARRHATKPLVERHCLVPLGGEDRARDRAIGHAVEPHLAQLGGRPPTGVQRLAESPASGAAAVGEGPVEIEEQRSHAPETTSSAKRMVGEAVQARNSRSSPTASIPRSISSRLPLTVTSCTGYASSPFSIQMPFAPRE